MIARLCVLTTAIFFSISSLVQADDFSTERIVKSLKEQGKIDFTLTPTLHAYQDLCGEVPSSNLNTQISAICDIVLKSPICKDVPEEKRLNCHLIENNSQANAWDFLKGCAKGVFESIKNFLNFIWEIMKWVWDNATDSEKRTETVEQASEYLNIVKLYLHTEFEKAYDNTSSPFRTVKALKSMGGSLANLILKSLTNLVSQKYQELGCLNFEAKSQVVCQFVSDIFAPPAAAIALIKFGPKVIKSFPNLKEAFSKLNGKHLKRPDLTEMGRILESEKILKRSIPPDQRNAIMKAHEVGRGAKGKNGSPARIGNYTISQLRKKAKLLKKAGFNQSEIRQLMENGIVGLSPAETRGFIGYVGTLFRRNPEKAETKLPPKKEAPANPRLGEEVSIPRSAGGRSVGKVTGITSRQVRVEFIDADGKKKYKWVDKSRLKSPKDFQPIPSAKEIIPSHGSFVAIPRTGGGMSNAQIVENFGDRVRVVFTDTDGLLKEKTVNIDQLRNPIDTPTGHIYLEGNVSNPPLVSGKANGSASKTTPNAPNEFLNLLPSNQAGDLVMRSTNHGNVISIPAHLHRNFLYGEIKSLNYNQALPIIKRRFNCEQCPSHKIGMKIRGRMHALGNLLKDPAMLARQYPDLARHLSAKDLQSFAQAELRKVKEIYDQSLRRTAIEEVSDSTIARNLGRDPSFLAGPKFDNFLQKKFPKLAKKLSADDRATLRSYATGTKTIRGFPEKLNAIYRGAPRRGEIPRAYRNYMSRLDRAITKLPRHQGDVFRYLTLSAEEINSFKRAVGKPKEFKGITSTTPQRGNFALNNVANVEMIIRCRRRCYSMDSINFIENEREVVLRNGAKLIVRQVSQRDGKTVIELVEKD